ncbi:hypothetical protein AGDE_03197 [Angomonas deanei]|uniref:Leucine Rich repeat, putative n=1 Tax=Angomonas deanei TaxID=59799 RepID=A0A7G2CSV2_9TRYP|nr:hypothetical protein AGDE_03197 [Angomonas deanei]CAD2222858.1 Leucine Rich repeat, putative [Angomonas deanei]|eukprot:EPY40730.1 hypothetical protein AGDE_03197 [Angomonas deanei]
MRFFPDERIPFTKTPLKTRQDIAQRRLCLAYIAPLLYLDGGLLFHIKLFVCRYAQLTDHDAAAVARILEEKTCTVEQMDLSHNAITDKGVKEFVDALKKNKTLVELILTENDQITSEKLLKSVERHLRRNREQKEKH